MIHRALIQSPDSAYVHLSAAHFYLDEGRDKKRGEEHLDNALTIAPDYHEAVILKRKLQVHRNWIVKFLTLPWTLACGIFRLVTGWAQHNILFIFTWPVAIGIGIIGLWIALCWFIFIFPTKKLFEFLVLRSEEVSWSVPPLLKPLFTLPAIARWAIWLLAGTLYSGLIPYLISTRDLRPLWDFLISGSGWLILLTIVIGFITIIWDAWRKRRLRRFTKNM
jgi:hypothetical protein